MEDLWNYLTNYTSKQSIFIKYLLKRLGFGSNKSEETYCYEYIEKLKGILKKEENLIDVLLRDYNTKKYIQQIPLKQFSASYLTASDLAEYVFCPVAFSINKTYETKSNIESDIGLIMHDERVLLSYLEKDVIGATGSGISQRFKERNGVINSSNQAFFTEIENSTLLYSGHSENRVPYINKDKNFTGQPDYVFRNSKGKIFIVEEKYHEGLREKTNFYNNHKIQLASYIYLLNQIGADYGYLVYWSYYRKTYYTNTNYNTINNQPVKQWIGVNKCDVMILRKNDNVESFLERTLNNVKSFVDVKSTIFELNSLNINKCVSCAYTNYCGHKTKRFTKITLPYIKDFTKLMFVPYPEELKKQDKDNTNLKDSE
ncbi:hypothetical protein GCM10023189_41800 [Nibrella saemangeumensis]|uniref:PD-(D/E)XK endonuclease-like domain-containing protein n=1 Tax=Nibrella saemangeumensis TaxID=1084526 RepID=A0ABP8ND52_9BACT